MNDIPDFLASLLAVVVLFVVASVVLIWVLNTLFGLKIAYDLKDIFAGALLIIIFGSIKLHIEW